MYRNYRNYRNYFGETHLSTFLFLKKLKGYTWIFKHLGRVNNFESIELFANENTFYI